MFYRLTIYSVDSRTSSRLTAEVLDILHRLTDKQDLLRQKAEAREQGMCNYSITHAVAVRH